MNPNRFILSVVMILVCYSVHASGRMNLQSSRLTDHHRRSNKLQEPFSREFDDSDSKLVAHQSSSRHAAITDHVRGRDNLKLQRVSKITQPHFGRARNHQKITLVRKKPHMPQSRNGLSPKISDPKRLPTKAINRFISVRKGSINETLDKAGTNVSQSSNVKDNHKFIQRKSSRILKSRDNKLISNASSTYTPLENTSAAIPNQLTKSYTDFADSDAFDEIQHHYNASVQDYIQRIFSTQELKDKFLSLNIEKDGNTKVVDSLLQAKLLLQKITGTQQRVTYNTYVPVRIDAKATVPSIEAFEYGVGRPLDVHQMPAIQWTEG